MSDENLHALLAFFKALADESRLKIVGILATEECSVGELAARLGLKEPTVSHHLAKLKELGLVEMRAEGNTHVYWLQEETLQKFKREILTTEKITSLVDGAEGEAWERKVLQNYFEGERLKQIPTSLKKRKVILRWLAGQFEPGTHYPEAAVNEIIQRHHPDFAALRREMVESHLMQRERNVYWRP